MKILDHHIVDNFGLLGSLEQLVGKDKYEWIIENWSIPKGMFDSIMYEKIGWEAGEMLDVLQKALRETNLKAKSLKNDDLFGIYYGLMPSEKSLENGCRLANYFVFRCSNNGRSLIVVDE